MKACHRSLGGVIMLAAALLASAGPAHGQRQEARALAAVRERIGGLQQRLDQEHAARERRYGALRRVELETAAAAESLGTVRASLAEQQGRRAELAAAARETAERLDRERAALASQVRMSYLTGHQETLQLVLNQQEPAQLGRMLTYYDYLNRARSRRIDNVSADLTKVAELTEATERITQELAALERRRSTELEALEQLRTERQLAVSDLDATIASDEAEIERLREEEARLTELVRELETLLAEFPVDSQEPFSSTRGALAWPVTGKILSRFGESRAGPQLRWHGDQIGAPAGTPVRSIYHGRVVYSDWLPGLGLLVIVDHGEGYMSLYGHNEVVLRESGDWVAPGEVIAQVGDSGGQAQTALYFEIRRNGEPVDPGDWMNRAAPQQP